jgi:N-acetyltransferase 10
LPGVSYGLTQDLLRFWKKSGFVPVYLRQTANDLTGEHSAIMLRLVHHQDEDEIADQHGQWLSAFGADFRRRFVNLLGYDFRKFSPGTFSYY